MRRLLTLLITAATLSIGNTALADGADPAAAAALFQEGHDLAKRGEYAAACTKLAESYRLDPATGTLLNLADCNEHLGKTASAWQLFQQAVEHLAPNDPRTPIAKQRIAALNGKLPRLTVILAPTAGEGTKVVRDKVELGKGSLGAALPVDPGEHTIVVTSPEHDARSYKVRAVEGKTEQLVVSPGAPIIKTEEQKTPPPPPPIVTPPPPQGLGTLRVVGIAAGGVGIVGIGAAIATGLMLPDKQKTVDAHCGADNFCDPVGYEAAQSGKTLASANTALWFAGGVFAAAGAALVIFGGPSAEAPKSASVQIAPLPGGVSIAGRF